MTREMSFLKLPQAPPHFFASLVSQHLTPLPNGVLLPGSLLFALGRVGALLLVGKPLSPRDPADATNHPTFSAEALAFGAMLPTSQGARRP